MKKVTLVIPTCNHNEDLFKCLKSINDTVDDKTWNVKVIVVDDHSTKQNREELITNIVKYNIYKNLTVSLIFNSRNVGFMKSCNVALKCILNEKKIPDYIGILHDDVKVLNNWIEKLTATIAEDISVYVASSMSNSSLDVHNIRNLKIREIGEEEIKEENLQTTIDTFVGKDLSFEDSKFQMFATMFKPDAFIKFGLFDEDNLTSINGEYEFAKRMNDNNRKVVIVPTACVVHKTRMLSSENPNQLTYSKAIAVTDWINSINAEIKTARYAVYTFVRSSETLPKIEKFDDSINYICFTTNDDLYSKRGMNFPWKMFKVDEVATYFGFPKESIKMKEFLKINPHLILKNSSISIWIDPNLNVLKDLTDLSKMMNPKNFLLALDDINFDCLYRKLIYVKNSAYVTEREFNDILQIYKWCRYPQENGAIDTSLLIRKHTDERCKLTMNTVWNFVLNTFANDELFINFVLWKNKYDYTFIPANLVRNEYIKTKESL